MKAIILAAGKGTRLRPITNTTPKPLIKIFGKTIIEHNLEIIYKHVDEIVIVVKYLKEKFIEELGDNYRGTKITYHEQGEDKGTGGAIRGIKMNSDILLLNGDSIFDKIDIESLIKLNGYGCLVKEVSEPEKYGIFKEENSIAKSIVEKPQEYIGNLANLGVYKFSKSILDLVDIIELSPRGEFEITDAINSFIEQENFKLITIIGDFIDIGYPEDIEVAENLLKSKYRDIIKNKPIFGDIVKIDSIGNLNLCYGIDSNLIKMLIDFSQDESDIDLQKNAGDKKRFTTRENIEKWYNSTDRIVLTLVDDSNYIAGIWWGRPCDMPIMDNQNQEAYRKLEEKKDKLHTSAVRIYREYRGKKISSKFVELCLKYYRLIHSNGIMCADVNDDNIAMKKGFLRAGYTELGIGENKKSIGENTSIKRKIFIKEF